MGGSTEGFQQLCACAFNVLTVPLMCAGRHPPDCPLHSKLNWTGIKRANTVLTAEGPVNLNLITRVTEEMLLASS